MFLKKYRYILLPVVTILLIISIYYYCINIVNNKDIISTNSAIFNAADKIEIINDDKKLVMTKNYTSWHLQDPFPWKINKYAIDRFLQLIGKIKTSSDLSITLYRNNSVIYKVPISNTISKNTLKTLINLNFWCNNLLSLSLYSSSIISIYDDKENINYSFQKHHSKWQMEFPVKLDIENSNIKALFDALSFIDIEKFLWYDNCIKNKLVLINSFKFISTNAENLLNVFMKKDSKKHTIYLQYNNYPVIIKTKLDHQLFNIVNICNKILLPNINTINFTTNNNFQILLKKDTNEYVGIASFGNKIYECDKKHIENILKLINNIHIKNFSLRENIQSEMHHELKINLNDKNIWNVYSSAEKVFLKNISYEKYLIEINPNVLNDLKTIIADAM